MKIALLEPFYTGSHQQWAETYQQRSQQHVEIFSLPGRHWKWRMHGGAVSLAKAYLESGFQADLLLASDMLDLNTFLGLTRQQTHQIPAVVYFHENQLTYPWSPDDQDVAKGQDLHYAFINYTTALAADAVLFNSQYHQASFLQALPSFLRRYPDFREADQVPLIQDKSQVLPLGLSLKKFLPHRPTRVKQGPAILLWNHRWEYDKGPEDFFEAVFSLEAEGVDYQLVVLGESFQKSPAIFAKAQKELAHRIIHWGFADSFEAYARLLWQADILYGCSRQDFFGGSVVEAIYCQCHPILPNRLAFPEHFPPGQGPHHLYNSTEEGLQMLRQAIQQIDEIRQANHYQNFVAHYDWSTLARQYDDTFLKICQ
ncbi:MAG: DUF3524 domain-containing protein [Bacteroidota bacterium]